MFRILSISLTLAATLFVAARGGTVMAQPPPQWDLDTPLFYLSENKADVYTLADSFQHNLVLGQTGSGKSSTTARVLLHSMLRAGYGGMLTCVKTTDRADYVRYAQEAGREKDLIIVTLKNGIPWRLNFLEYESRRAGDDGIAEALVYLFENILEIVERGKQSSGGDPFWKRSSEKLIRNGIVVLRAAGVPISLPNLWKLAVEAPTSPAEVDDPKWRDRSFLFQCLKAGDEAPKNTQAESLDFDQSATEYLQSHARMGDICRGSVLATFGSTISPFLMHPLREMFQNSTNFVPEMCENGAIIILDMPVQEYKELGQISQVLLKLLFMRAMERRDVEANPRPVFLFSDEHQFAYSSHDQMFMTTARALRVSCTLITQNISNFYAILPGDKGRAETDSLFGNCGTKWLHMNTDQVSNTWASNLIGSTRLWFQGVSTALPPAIQSAFALGSNREPARTTASMNQHETHEVPTQTFHMLRSGGKRNDLNVDAVVFSGGRCWSTTGRNWMITTFKQGEV